MKNYLQKILIQLSLKKIDKKTITKWYRERNVELLKFALKKGLYPQRIEAIQALKKLRNTEMIPDLLTIARKDFEPVSNAALEAIEELDTHHKFAEEVKQMKAFLELRKKPSKTENDNPVMLNRSKMQNLEQVRKMLKTPMGGGKWF